MDDTKADRVRSPQPDRRDVPEEKSKIEQGGEDVWSAFFGDRKTSETTPYGGYHPEDGPQCPETYCHGRKSPPYSI